MSALILRFMPSARLGGLRPLVDACKLVIEALADAQEMARAAQRRYPFSVE